MPEPTCRYKQHMVMLLLLCLFAGLPEGAPKVQAGNLQQCRRPPQHSKPAGEWCGCVTCTFTDIRTWLFLLVLGCCQLLLHCLFLAPSSRPV